MVVEAGQFSFKRLLDRVSSNSPNDGRLSRMFALPTLDENSVLRDIDNLKQRMMPSIGGGRPREDQQQEGREDLHRIRVELCRQIQRDTGRSRIENLQFFQKLERKEQRDMRLEAKTILMSIKKEAKLAEPVERSPKKKSRLSETSLTVLNPLRLSSTVNIMERVNKTVAKTTLLPPSRQLTDSVVERKQSRTALRANIESALPEDSPRRQSLDRQAVGNGLQILNTAKVNFKRKNSGGMQLQTGKHTHCEKLERYRAFLNKVSFANVLCVEPPAGQAPPKKLVYHVGRGNNSELVRSLMKRRYWWTEGPIEQANFVWTQLKKQDIFNRQSEHSDKPELTTSASLLNNSFCSDSSRDETGTKGMRSRPAETISQEDKIMMAVELQEWAKQPSTKLLRKVEPRLVHNHMPGNCHLGNKKALFFNLRKYCQLTNRELFDMVPMTFHVGEEYKQFEREFRRRAQLIKEGARLSNVWIVKPGENSNRGNGIHVIESMRELDELLAQRKHHANGEQLTYIVQQYMSRPFLYNRRKFDIRHYLLITSFGRSVRAYWYKQGYIRTSSQLFDLDNTKNSEIHLTNDAIQKHSETYGKYEEANKLSYSEFQRYLEIHHKERKYSFADVLLKMRQIATLAVHATYSKLDPTNKEFNFEVFGLDFMLDENLRPWLIEVNTNPCLELSSSLLGRVIPNMVEHALRMSLDPLFPPPADCPANQRHYIACKVEEYLKFEVIFSSEVDGPALRDLYLNQQQPQLVNIEEDDEEYCDEGRAINFVE